MENSSADVSTIPPANHAISPTTEMAHIRLACHVESTVVSLKIADLNEQGRDYPLGTAQPLENRVSMTNEATLRGLFDIRDQRHHSGVWRDQSLRPST